MTLRSYPPPLTEQTAYGKYTLLKRIAVGGMAEIFRALEPRAVGAPRVVVIKRLLPDIAAEPRARALFAQEARLGALVEHPNVSRLLDAGEEHGQPYLVFRHVPGIDLARFLRWLRRQGLALSSEMAIFLVIELLRGLHAVHEATDERGEPLAIVHRDVSPSNLLLSTYGDVILSDLGIARPEREVSGVLAKPQRTQGKLGYLSPEQVRGDPCDRRSDLFAVGVIAAELLMGRRLFSGKSELATLLAIRDAQIEVFENTCSKHSAEMITTIKRSLTASPEARFATAADFERRLLPFLAEEAPMRAELAAMVTRASADIETDRGKRRTRDSGEAEEITADSPELRYLVETVAGPILGPMSYAKVVEAVATGAVSPDDVIRLGGEGPGQRLSEIADLYRHVPASGKLDEVTRNVGSPKPPERVIEIGEVPAHGGIARGLALSAMGRETGLWLCEQGEIRKEVFLIDGRPEFVTSNVAGELLGEFLVARSVISRGELEMALALLPRFEGRLGDTLNALGLVEPVELFQHIGAQVREKLLEIFTWEGGTASFYAGVSPPTSGFPLGLEPWELLDSGIARAARQERTPLFDPESASFVVKKPPPKGLIRGLLPAAARRLLVLTARPRSLAVLETSMKESEGVDADGTRRAVRLLLALDAIVLRK